MDLWYMNQRLLFVLLKKKNCGGGVALKFNNPCAFSGASCQPWTLPMGGSGTCRLYHYIPAHKKHLQTGRYCMRWNKLFVLVYITHVIALTTLPLTSLWQMSLTTLTLSSTQIPLSHAGLSWWTWRKEATHTRTSTSSISSRTVILKFSPGYRYGNSAKMTVMPRFWCDMQSSRGKYGSKYRSIILASALLSVWY